MELSRQQSLFKIVLRNNLPASLSQSGLAESLLKHTFFQNTHNGKERCQKNNVNAAIDGVQTSIQDYETVYTTLLLYFRDCYIKRGSPLMKTIETETLNTGR